MLVVAALVALMRTMVLGGAVGVFSRVSRRGFAPGKIAWLVGLFGMFWIARLGRWFYVRRAGGSIVMSAVAGLIVVIVMLMPLALLVLHRVTRGAAGE